MSQIRVTNRWQGYYGWSYAPAVLLSRQHNASRGRPQGSPLHMVVSVTIRQQGGPTPLEIQDVGGAHDRRPMAFSSLRPAAGPRVRGRPTGPLR